MPIATIPTLVVPRCSHNVSRAWIERTFLALVLALVGLFLIGPAVMKCNCSSKVDVAKRILKKYADAAYPQWSKHHGGGCPPDLQALNEYINHKGIGDPWGQDYRMRCDAGLTDGATTIVVWSTGEDGVDGTDDDIRSWK